MSRKARGVPGGHSQTPGSRTTPLHFLLRFLLPLLLAFIVLWTGYSSAADRRYDAFNGFSGQILAGGSVGQTFVARYDDLSGIEVRIGTAGRQADPRRAPLVMHLRFSPSSNSDLATATLSPSVVLDENGWYRFTFPAINDSKDKSYYVQIDSPGGTLENSLTLFWFKPSPAGDPFSAGTAYLSGKPTKADLAFGLSYSASPLEVWSGMFTSAGQNSSPVVLWTLLLAAVALFVWSLVWLPRIWRDQASRKRWLARWSLSFVLAVAFVYGLLFMLVVPPWQGPDEYSHFAYAVLLDTHNLDSRQVDALNLSGKDRDQPLIDAVNASMDSHDFTRLFIGSDAPGAPTDAGPYIFQQVRQPATYYWLCAVATRVARVLGAPADPYTNPEGALMAMRGVSLLLYLVVVVLAWLAGVLLAPDEPPTSPGRPSSVARRPSSPLRLFLPLTVALLPMPAFIGTVVNNDILAEVAVSALFVTLVALLRHPSGWQALALAALSVILTLATVETKSTATAAAVPLVAGGLLVWILMRLAERRHEITARLSFFANRRLLPASLLALTLLVVAIILFSLKHDDHSASGWFVSYDPLSRASRVQSDTAHQGSYVIELNTSTSRQASQNLVPPVYHPAFDITFTGWVRLAPGQAPVNNTQARLSILDDTRVAGSGEVRLDPGGSWTVITATGKINASAGRVRLALQAAGNTPAGVQFDDLALRIAGAGAQWNDPIFKPSLIDPSAEEPPSVLNDLLSRFAPSDVKAMVDVVANPQVFDKGALWSVYAGAQYLTFWGSFGWVTIYLPTIFFVLLSILSVVALVGLIVNVWVNGWSRWASLGLVVLLSLGATILISFAKQTSLLAYTGLPANPQGRYLFVIVTPIAWLLLTGLSAFTPLPFHRLTDNRLLTTDNLLFACALIFFAAYPLLALILPFYYS